MKTDPIAICEWGSIGDNDMIVARRVYKDRVGGILNLSYNPGQRWYYFPEMERDEVILLKCFDSERDGRARWTAHGRVRGSGRQGPRPSRAREHRSQDAAVLLNRAAGPPGATPRRADTAFRSRFPARRHGRGATWPQLPHVRCSSESKKFA